MLRPKKRLTRKEIKQDKLVTVYFKTVEFLQKNLTYMLAGITAIVIIMFASVMITQSKKSAENSAAKEFIAGQVEYERGNYQDAAEIFRTMINNFSGTQNAKIGTYYLANTYYYLGEYDQALEYYEEFVQKHGNDKIFGCPAMLGVANCLIARRQFEAAAEKFIQVVKKWPDSIRAPESLLNAGLAYMEAGARDKAIQAFEQLLKKYPDAQVKSDAELFLAKLQNVLS